MFPEFSPEEIRRRAERRRSIFDVSIIELAARPVKAQTLLSGVRFWPFDRSQRRLKKSGQGRAFVSSPWTIRNAFDGPCWSAKHNPPFANANLIGGYALEDWANPPYEIDRTRRSQRASRWSCSPMVSIKGAMSSASKPNRVPAAAKRSGRGASRPAPGRVGSRPRPRRDRSGSAARSAGRRAGRCRTRCNRTGTGRCGAGGATSGRGPPRSPTSRRCRRTARSAPARRPCGRRACGRGGCRASAGRRRPWRSRAGSGRSPRAACGWSDRRSAGRRTGRGPARRSSSMVMEATSQNSSGLSR